MKKVMLFAAVAVMAGSTLTSCKKGENDPFLSLKSRKARISGEWVVESASGTDRDTDSAGETTTTVSSISSGTLAITTTTSAGTDTESARINTYKYTFDKNGTFTLETELVSTDNTIAGQTITTTSKVMEEGTWNFLGRVDDFKNKERIILNTLKESETETVAVTGTGAGTTTTSSSRTFVDGDNNVVWAIDQLKNKEMIVKSEGSSSFSSTDQAGNTVSGSSTTEGELTFTKE